MKKLTIGILVVASSLMIGAHAFGQAAVQKAFVSSSAAADLVRAAVRQCEMDGYNVAATVVDPSGNVVAMLRGDKAAITTVDISRRKAFTAAAFRSATGDLAKRLSNAGNAFAALSQVDNVLVLEGGIPITYRGEVIGAIGVSGAPGGQFDAACAQKALEQNKALSGGGGGNG